MSTSNSKKKIKLRQLMNVLEKKLEGLTILPPLRRSVSIGEDTDPDASQAVIKQIRQCLDDCLAKPSTDTTVNQQIEAMSEFLKEYEHQAKNKLSLDKFKIAVQTNLSKMPLGLLFLGSKLECDKEGNLQPQVIENIKILLDKAISMTSDENAKKSMKAMRVFMEDYE